MPSLKQYANMIAGIARNNKWSKTPNVTLLESAKHVLNATDKWRRNHPTEAVVEEIVESIFFLLATCVKLDHNIDLDKLFNQVCKAKEGFAFEGVPDDLVWSFILYETEPHVDYRGANAESQQRCNSK